MAEYQPQTPMQGRPRQHSRSKSGFSFKSANSDKSDKSKPKSPKVDLHETHEEKAKGRFTERTTANPNRAINEDQPATRAQEKATIGSLRSLQLKDIYGNPIAEPDSSNPTRPRMERPLDTIRSFEAAIDSGYKRRNPVQRADTSDAMTTYSSRRSSMGEDPRGPMSPRYGPGGGYNASRHQPSRQTMYDPYGPTPPQQGRYSPQGLYNQQGAYPSPSGYPPRQQRNPSSYRPPMGGVHHSTSDYGVYPTHQYHESNDTFATTGSGSGSASEPWANSTDPSSENSSVDRNHQHRAPADQGVDAYGAQGQYKRGEPVSGAIMEEQGPSALQATGFPPREGQPGNHPAQHSYQNGTNGMRPPVAQAYPPQQNASGPVPSPALQAQQQLQQAQRKLIKLDSRGQRGGPVDHQGSSPNPASAQPQAYARQTAPHQALTSKPFSGFAASAVPVRPPPPPEKRKSWLRRRFSKG